MNQTVSSDGFYGEILSRRQVGAFTLSESAYLPDTKLPQHSHEHSYLCILLQGTYTERYGSKVRECKPSTVVFHPPDEVHANHFLKKGGKLFRLALDHQWLARVREHSSALRNPADFNGGSLAWLAIRLHEEFLQTDSVSPLVIEGLALEIVGELSRRTTDQAERHTPHWLKLARELLREQFEEPLVLSSIADSVGVHPVHFARVFRKFHGCTVGEYVRQLRVESASHKLIASDAPLAEIAISSGFSDQSHFSKTFKHATGMTPAQYRAAFRSR
ncbi:MAG TPA: AraC family transcriptional regulator [Blastocatellia bacterium]|nr:AraC family transcriptional regulator [Blastocatellia bacterium]